MIKRILIGIILYFIACMTLFLFMQKPLFLLYNQEYIPSSFSLQELKDIYVHGWALDAAMAAYLCIVPLLTAWAMILYPQFKGMHVIRAYNVLVSIVLAWMIVTDAVLYDYWEFKLDATIFLYLDNPAKVCANVSPGFIVVRLVCIMILNIVFFFLLMWPSRFFKAVKGLNDT